eukprot:jgi/Psemu1/262199/estExt_Genewise1Plus.C_7110001
MDNDDDGTNDNDNNGNSNNSNSNSNSNSSNNDNSNSNNEEWHYFVHYEGWKTLWDRWVSEKDILEATEDNIERMKEISRLHKQVQREIRSKNNGKKIRDGGLFLRHWKHRLDALHRERRKKQRAARKTKKRRTTTTTKNRQQPSPEEVLRDRSRLAIRSCLVQRPASHIQSIPLSFGLKRILVEDWENLNNGNRDRDRDDSKKSRGDASSNNNYNDNSNSNSNSNSNNNSDNDGDSDSDSDNDDNIHWDMVHVLPAKLVKEWTDMAEGIVLYFEEALVTRLLYPSEVSQILVLEEMLLEDNRNNDANNNDNDNDNNNSALNEIGSMILAKLRDLARFLQKNQATLFASMYRKKNERELKRDAKYKKRQERRLKQAIQRSNNNNNNGNNNSNINNNGGSVSVSVSDGHNGQNGHNGEAASSGIMVLDEAHQ